MAWDEHGPRSLHYDDIYFSSQDGLAESRAVFLDGCGLPDAWSGRDRFTVAELGFGTGLNIAALLDLWRRTAPPAAHLSIFSSEAHLLSQQEATRALEPWSEELAEPMQALLAAWPRLRQGFHRIALPGFRATLDLYIGDVGEALQRWSGPANAWFLDGFAPARNPQMWRDEVLAAVARLSAPGAALATFTVAGHVRRGLEAAGFEVARRPGYGAKRQRLEGRLGSETPRPGDQRRCGHVAIVGGGIAGAALVRAFHRQGVACTLVEAVAAGAGASGNPAALVSPRLDSGFGPAAELHAQAFAHATDLYRREAPEAVIAAGALQLGGAAREAERFARLAGWGGFAPAALQPLLATDAAVQLDEDDSAALTALLIADALVVEPSMILAAWLAPAVRVRGSIAELQAGGRWLCRDAAGAVLAEADAVCIAAGFDTAALVPGVSLRPIRGQLSFTDADVFTGTAAAWGAYAIPLRRGGALFGASHKRGDAQTELRAEETAANLAALAVRRPALATRVQALAPDRLRARAAVRATTPDHMPLAGEADRPGLFVLGGLGGRGFTLAPLLAEHVAALAIGAPSPISNDLARRLRPIRSTPANPTPA